MFMEIIQPNLNWCGSLAKRSVINMIVLHHAAAKRCTVDNIHNWHLANGWSGVGYHYFVRKDGTIFKGRPDNTIGAHANGYNSTSLGVCFEGDFEQEIPSQIQINAGLELVAYLKKKYNIQHIKAHKDLMATSCPGKYFPINQFKDIPENLVLSFQQALLADGFKLPKFGADGMWGSETESAASKCIVKKRLIYKYKNATKLVQRLLNIQQDGKCGKDTDAAIRKFQQQNSLNVDGCVGLLTWKKLIKGD
jgi:hypothetical protein